MSYSVEYDPQTGIIYGRITGELTLESVREFTNAAALLAKEKDCFRVLTDVREASIQLSMLEVYSIPRMTAEITSALGLAVQKFRRAVLLPDQWNLSRFFETVSKNRVQNVTLFYDIAAARQWLLEK